MRYSELKDAVRKLRGAGYKKTAFGYHKRWRLGDSGYQVIMTEHDILYSKLDIDRHIEYNYKKAHTYLKGGK